MSSIGHTWTIPPENVRSGSKHPMFGKKHSKESIQKMSDCKVGKPTGRTGFKHTPEAIEKMRLAHGRGKDNPLYGRTRSQETKDKIRTKLLGHHVPEETRKKISEKIHGRLPEYVPKLKAAWADPEKKAKRILENNPCWKGGISYEPYCPKFNNEFKERVRAFFGYHCVECGTPQNGKRLSVHHVNFNKQACCDDTPPMFVPLCHDCHIRTNKNRDYWKIHFSNMINNYYGGKCYFTKEEHQRGLKLPQ